MRRSALAWTALILPLLGCSSGDDHVHYALAAYVEPQGVTNDSGSSCTGMPTSAPGGSGGQINSRLWLQMSWSNSKGRTSYDVALYHFEPKAVVVLGADAPPADAVPLSRWTFDESLVGSEAAFEDTVVDGAVTNKVRIVGSYESCAATKPTGK